MTTPQAETPDTAVEWPHRRFHLELDLQGDTLDDVAMKLDDLLWQIRSGSLPAKSTFGGISIGGHLTWTVDPSQTNERYFNN